MESIIGNQKGSMALRLKQLWSQEDTALVNMGNISECGVTKMWMAVDGTIRYADWKLQETGYFMPKMTGQHPPHQQLNAAYNQHRFANI